MMAREDLPRLNVVLTPKFHHTTQEPVELQIRLLVGSVQFEEGLSVFDECSTNVNSLEIWDRQGLVPLSSGFKIGRQTMKDLNICYNVISSSKNEFKLGKPVVGLHSDRSGFLGSGMSIMPFVSKDKIFQMFVQWDLATAPQGTRAVWTYGEGPGPVEKIGPTAILRDSVYMVGQIKSSSSTSDTYGYYWFDDLPPNVQVIRDIHHEFFMKASDFFSDTPSTSNPYRHFIRNTKDAKSFGGTSFTRSHVFNFDHQIDNVDDYDLIRHLAYEMASLFLGPSTISTSPDWLFEGIAGYLAICFPFRFKFRTGHYFQATINVLCTRYYTNPLINFPHDELLKLVPTSIFAREQLYARAWAFVIGTDFSARRMSDLMRPIEDLAIKPMVNNKAVGEPHGIEVWLEGLKGLMGTEAQERYEEFLSGSTILLNTALFGAKTHYLKPVDMEIVDFGMERESFEEGVVKGLKSGSRAENAGIREGETILWNSHLWKCVDHFGEVMEMGVLRDDEEVRIKYWPRGFERVESWWMVKRDEEGELEKWLEGLREEHGSF